MSSTSTLPARSLTGLIALSLLAPLPIRADETIRCDSPGFDYRYCRIDTDNRVELVRQHSLIGCHQDRSWGYDRHGVWVDRGCSADFRVGRDRGHNNKALAVGAAVAGVALLALLTNRSKPDAAAETSSWAVGSFTGYDDFEKTEVSLTILPGGSVTGRAGRNEFTGNLAGTRLQAGRHQFQIQSSGNGFIATDDQNAGHRVVFQRSGGGY